MTIYRNPHNGQEQSRTAGDRSPKCVAFLTELRDLCQRHEVTLCHEDAHGGFEVHHGFDPKSCDGWLMQASEEL